MPRSLARFARRPGEASCMMRPWPGLIFFFATFVLLAALIAPVAALVAAMPPGEAMRTFARIGGDALRVSFLASAGATLVATLLGVPAGYFLSRLPPRLRASAIFLLALPLAFPPVASGIMLVYALGTNSPVGAWLSARGLTVPDSLLGVGVAEFLRLRIVRRDRGDGGIWRARFHLWRFGAHAGRERMANLHSRRSARSRRKHRGRSRVCVASRDRRIRRDQHSRVPSNLIAGRALRCAFRFRGARSARPLLRLRRFGCGRTRCGVDSAPRGRTLEPCSRRTFTSWLVVSSRARG